MAARRGHRCGRVRLPGPPRRQAGRLFPLLQHHRPRSQAEPAHRHHLHPSAGREGLHYHPETQYQSRGHAANEYQLVNVRPPATDTTPASEANEPPGAAAAPGQDVHQGSAADSPGLVQEVHHPAKQLHPKETQRRKHKGRKPRRRRRVMALKCLIPPSATAPPFRPRRKQSWTVTARTAGSRRMPEPSPPTEALASVTGRDVACCARPNRPNTP